VGSVLGGIVAAWLGRDAVFAINSLSFAASAFLISRMHFFEGHTEASRRHIEDPIAIWEAIRAGYRYIAHDPKMTALVSLKGGVSIVGTSWVLFPVMAMWVFALPVHNITTERSALFGMSLLMGARGVGALIGPLLASRWTGQREANLRRAVLAGFFTGGVGYVLLSLTHNIWLAAAVIVFAHCGTSTVWVFSTTLLHLNAEDRFLGRVFGADLAISMLLLAAAAWAAGRAIDAGIAPRTVALGTGVTMAIPTVAWGFAMRMWRSKHRADTPR